ncbi:MFS transporter [Alkalibacter mobilis]|uniref:MFS transporter n=1 Tax=Alkalibacter mobilis TaxID=2787712 RepID=UPI0018A0B67A|nr:MFS transporter [Alkalibacter mobilis]MBF7097847.1 MFS transporter [Alkalibacter mobilis]
MKNNKVIKIAVLSIYFVLMSAGAVNPALASIAAAFPDVSFTTILLISTLPQLLSVPATLAAGRLAGSIIKYKTLLTWGMILFVVGGVAPYFIKDITNIIVMRAVYGIGLGLVMPMGMALAIAYFDGEEREKMIGSGTLMQNVGGIFFTLIAGLMASVTWNLTFLVHTFGIFTIILTLFLPEPDKVQVGQNAEGVPRMPIIVYGLTLFIFVVMVLFMPMMLNMSSVILERGMGNAASSGLVLTVFTVGGMIAGALFAKVYKVFNTTTFSIGLGSAAIGLAAMAYGNTILFMYVATFFSGFGTGLIIPAIFVTIGMKVHPTQISMATGIVLAALNSAAFPTPYIIAFISGLLGQSNNSQFPYIFGMIGYLSLAVLAVLFLSRNKKLVQVKEQ